LNDSLNITQFSSKWQLAPFYGTGAMSSTKIMWLMQFRKITACFGANDKKHTNTTCRLNSVLFLA